MEKKVEFREGVEYEEIKGGPMVGGKSTAESESESVSECVSECVSEIEADEKVGWETVEDETYKTFQEQDEKWKGADVDARQHLSHREAHAEFRIELARAIANYQTIEEWVMLIHCNITEANSTNRMRCLNHDILRLIAEFCFAPGHGAVVQMIDQNLHQSFCQHAHYRQLQQLQKDDTAPVQPFFIYIRKRPLLAYELQRGNYNVVDVNTYDLESDALNHVKNNNEKAASLRQPFSNLVEVHDGKLARNGRILEMKHKVYAVSEAFSENASNQEVCEAAVEPLVAQVQRGLPATILFYGQTGTGKTHTLLGALKYIATRFAGARATLTFYEIRGKKSYDLLHNRAIVHLRSDEHENVHVRGCREINFDSLKPKEFMAVLKAALENRSSKVTERNPVSSRSHAVCTVDVECVGKPGCRATLRLVDLAGSERNYETSAFTAADHRESAEINFALMALKNCFRAYNSSFQPDNKAVCQRAPYRASLLTRVLRECFIRGKNHTTSVIATVSPSPTDLEHTLNTLEHVTMMDPALETLPIQRCVAVDVMIDGCAPPNSPVDTWTYRELMAWLSHTDGGKFSQLVLPANMSGQDLLNLNMKSLTALCAGQLRDAREGDEGSAWVEEGEATKGQMIIAKRLFATLRREQNASLLRQSKVHNTL